MGYSIVTDDDVLQIRATVGSQAEMAVLLTALQQRQLELPESPTGDTNDRGNNQPISGDVPNEYDRASRITGAIATERSEQAGDFWKNWPPAKGGQDPLHPDHPPAKDREPAKGGQG